LTQWGLFFEVPTCLINEEQTDVLLSAVAIANGDAIYMPLELEETWKFPRDMPDRKSDKKKYHIDTLKGSKKGRGES